MSLFDDYDEVDTAMMCLMSENELEEAEKDIEQGLSAFVEAGIEDPDTDEPVIDTMDIELDDSITDPVGEEAEDEIDAEQELLTNDGDGDLIDLVSSTSDNEEF